MIDSGLDELLGQIPIGQLAGQLGVSEDEADQAVCAALPALLGGMEANAQDPAGAASLAKALGQHDGSLLDGGVDLAQVDTADGLGGLLGGGDGGGGGLSDMLGGLLGGGGGGGGGLGGLGDVFGGLLGGGKR